MAMATGRAHQQRYRERRRQIGAKPYDLWLTPEGQVLVCTLPQPGERLEAIVMRALQALQDLTRDPCPPRPMDKTVTSDRLLFTVLQLLFPEGRPVCPRRAYGLRTLLLHALNTILARHGSVLHAAKVRNQDWFVTCTDAQGHGEAFGIFEPRPMEGEA